MILSVLFIPFSFLTKLISPRIGVSIFVMAFANLCGAVPILDMMGHIGMTGLCAFGKP